MSVKVDLGNGQYAWLEPERYAVDAELLAPLPESPAPPVAPAGRLPMLEPDADSRPCPDA